MINLFIIKLI